MAYPLVGVTTSRIDTKYSYPAHAVAEKYVRSLADSGAAPVLIPLGLSEDQLERIFAALDGILFTGGGDIHPSRFGEHLDENSKMIDEDRDRVELELFHRTVQRGLPFFGICRGFQLVNVGMGGTLYTDILEQHPDAMRHDFFPDFPRDMLAHSVQISPNSVLYGILGEESIQVNSLHHQGIREVASQLLPSAASPDGIIEGVELRNYPFGLAVQWHPEWLQEYQPMRSLFQTFVQACAAPKNNSA